MSKTVDERVVKMTFDNQNFDPKVNASMNTIDKLKSKLNFTGASKGLETMASATDSVKVKFSALNTVAMTAVMNITNNIVNSAKSIMASLTTAPIDAGYNEYESKLKSIKVMMASTGKSIDEVNAHIDDLAEYANKTIYSFDDMTQSVSKFTNAGVSLDKSVLAIKGISNEAAVSGASAEEASRAMYNFAQALSAGHVQLIDWKSIENANMATMEFKQQLIDSAVAAGTLTKSADGLYTTMSGKTLNATKGFNDSLQDQWMTTDVLINTLSRYADETTEIGKKSYSAAKDVSSFSKLMDTLSESVQNGWSKTFELILGDYFQATNMWTKVNDVIGGALDKMTEARNKLIGGAMSSPWEQIKKQVSDAGVSVNDFQKALIETGKKHGKVTDEMISKAGGFEKSLKSGWLSPKILSETLGKFIGNVKDAEKSTDKMKNSLDELGKVADKVILGDFGNGEDRIKKLTAAGYDYATVQSIVNNKLLGTKININNLSDAQVKNMGYTDEQVKTLRKLQKQADETGTPLNELIERMSKPSGRELLLDSIANSYRTLASVFKSVRDAWRDMFPPATSEQLYNAIDAVHSFTEGVLNNVKSNSDSLTRTLKGLFAILKLISDILGGGLKIAFKILNSILGAFNLNILDFTAYIGDAIVAMTNWIEKHNLLNKVIEKTGPFVKKSIEKLKEWKDEVLSLPIVQNALDTAEKSIETFFKEGSKSVKTFIKNLKSMDKITFNGVVDTVKKFIDKIIDIFETAAKPVSNVANAAETVKKATKEVDKDTSPHLDNFKNNISKVKDVLGEFVEFVKGKLSNINLGHVLAIAFGVSFMATAKKAGQLMESISGFMDDIGAVPASISKFVDKVTYSMKKLAKAKAFSMKMDGVYTFAKAIAVLAGSIFLLSKMDMKKGLEGAGILLGTVGILSAALILINKKCDVKSSIKLGTMMASIGGAMILLSAAVKVLAGIDVGKAFIGISEIIIMMASLVASSIALAAFAPSMGKNSLMILSFAVSINILIRAIKSLSELDPKKATNTCKMLSRFILALAVSIRLMTKPGASSAKAGTSMLAVSAALLILTKVIKMVSKFTIGEMVTAVGIVGITIGFIYTLSKAMSIMGDAGKYAGKAGLSMLAISSSMLILVGVIKIVSMIGTKELVKGVTVINLLGVCISALIAVTSKAGENAAKAGVTILAFAGAMIALSVVMYIMGSLSVESIGKGLLAISGLTAMIMGLLVITKYTKNVKACSKLLISFSITIGVLSAAIAILSLLDTSKVIGASACIGAITGMLALLIKSTENAKKATSTLVLMAVIFAELTVVLFALSSLPIKSCLASAGALSLLMLTLSASILIISNSKDISASTVAVVGLMSTVLLAIGYIISILSGLPMNNAITIAASVGLLMVALSGAFFIISNSKVDPKTTISLGLMIGCLYLLGTVLSKMSEMPLSESVGNVKLLAVVVAGVVVAMEILGHINGGSILKNVLMMSAAIAAFSVSLMLLAPAIKSVGELSVESIVKTLVTLAAAIVVLGVAGTVLAPVLPVILGLSVALLGISVGALAAGVGIDFLAKGLAIIATLSINDLVQGLIALVAVFTALGIAGLLLSPITPVILMLGAAILALGVGLLSTAKAIQIIINLFQMFASSTTDGSNVIGNALKSIWDFFSNVFGNIFHTIGSAVSRFASSAGQMASNLWNGLKNGLKGLGGLVGGHIRDAVSAIKNKVGEWKDAGVNLIKGFISGIKSKAQAIVDAAKGVVKGAVDSIKHFLGIHSPSRLFKGIGQYCDLGLVNGFKEYSSKVANASRSVGKDAFNNMKRTLSNIADNVNENIDAQPTISPVMDLSDVINGTSQLNSLLSNNKAMTISTDMNTNYTKQQQKYEDDYNFKNRLLSDVDTIIKNAFENVDGIQNGDSTYVIEIPLNLDSREVARATAKYTKNEIEKIDRNALRRGGILRV